jgi:hypothetical protein
VQRLREIAPGVLVATAKRGTTTSTVVVAGDGGCLAIDPAMTAADLAGLAADLADGGLRPRLGFATHPHWDHVLWSRGLGDVPRYAAVLTGPTAAPVRTCSTCAGSPSSTTSASSPASLAEATISWQPDDYLTGALGLDQAGDGLGGLAHLGLSVRATLLDGRRDAMTEVILE